jgi:3-hydroxyacyl-[acyl-carrier-protein] dehydratase
VKFNLIDHVEEASAERFVGVKYVSLAEEYLADHFPTFPVLPGVMMLEALTQAAGWIIHLRRDFACSMAILKEARNVRYGSFVAPGRSLRVEVDLLKDIESEVSFKAAGLVGDAQAVSARLTLSYFNLADRQPELADVDRRLIEHHRNRWALIAPKRQEGVKLVSSP